MHASGYFLFPLADSLARLFAMLFFKRPERDRNAGAQRTALPSRAGFFVLGWRVHPVFVIRLCFPAF